MVPKSHLRDRCGAAAFTALVMLAYATLNTAATKLVTCVQVQGLQLARRGGVAMGHGSALLPQAASQRHHTEHLLAATAAAATLQCSLNWAGHRSHLRARRWTAMSRCRWCCTSGRSR